MGLHRLSTTLVRSKPTTRRRARKVLVHQAQFNRQGSRRPAKWRAWATSSAQFRSEPLQPARLLDGATSMAQCHEGPRESHVTGPAAKFRHVIRLIHRLLPRHWPRGFKGTRYMPKGFIEPCTGQRIFSPTQTAQVAGLGHGSGLEDLLGHFNGPEDFWVHLTGQVASSGHVICPMAISGHVI